MPSAGSEEARNFRLLGHDPSAAFGGGSLVEINKGHAYVGSVGASSFTAPEGFTAHDVTDPSKPRKVWEFKAPPGIHMHKVRVVDGDLLYVNSERLGGDKGKGDHIRTGFYIFDISRPAEPREVGFYDMPGDGPHRFGVDNQRQLALLPCKAEGWDNRVIWTLDIRDPLKPEIVSIWGLPWQKEGSEAAAAHDQAEPEHVCMLHGPPVIRDDRMFCAWWGGGVSVIDCTDLADMKLARPHQLVAAVHRRHAHRLAARRPPLPDRHRRGAGPKKISPAPRSARAAANSARNGPPESAGGRGAGRSGSGRRGA